MGWTEERVELLTKLWQDGLSASQIAKKLGGITRNAALGKMSRLGLTSRSAPSKPARTVFRSPRPKGPPSTPAALRRIPGPIQEQVIALGDPFTSRYVDEAAGSATMLTLGKHMCKWPIGDPALESFTFCGRRTGTGSYCNDHAQVSYQPTAAKKRSNGEELARSLRWYI